MSFSARNCGKNSVKLERCARCGCDHSYESTEAQKLHNNCILCCEERNTIGIGNGPDHSCEDNQCPPTVRSGK